MTKILIQPKAKEDIKNIWFYTFDAWGEKQADNYTTELGLTIESLVDNLEIGFTINHVKEGYRLYRFRQHFIVYRLGVDEILVTRILNKNMYVDKHL